MGKWVLLRSQTAIKSTQLRAILYQQQRSELSVAPVVPVGLMHPVVSSHCTAHRPFFTFAPQAHVARQRRRRRRFVRFCRKLVSFLPSGLFCSGTRIWRCLEAEEGEDDVRRKYVGVLRKGVSKTSDSTVPILIYKPILFIMASQECCMPISGIVEGLLRKHW